MKRHDNLMARIASMENLLLADEKARKGKRCRWGIRIHDRNKMQNLEKLQRWLREGTYRTSPYRTFLIHDPKEREIFKLPYFPDRIAHHAIMNVLEPIWVSTFASCTYACIKGRGIHAGVKAVKRALRDVEGTEYCLKWDIKKYYPSVDHDIMKTKIRKKIGDARLLRVLDEVIDSSPGLPIGNYLSQYLANVYLSDFDHWMKEAKGVKHYFRYADDMVVLGDKEYLRTLFGDIREYTEKELKLTIKGNWQIFQVDARGIDFLGYVFYHTHTRLRKRTKRNIFRKIVSCNRKGMTEKEKQNAMGSYYGWLKYCDSGHLKKTINEKGNGKIIKQSASCGRGEVGRGKLCGPLQHRRSCGHGRRRQGAGCQV